MKLIYIIDDQKEVTDLLKKILIKENYKAVSFYDGKSAINAIKDQPPNLVMLDVQMPKVDGFEVFNQLKSLSPKSKIIIMTAYADAEKSKFFLENGADDFIAKPFKLKDIRVIISRLLSKDVLSSSVKENRFNIVGQSDQIKKCVDMALKISNSDSSALVLGESGTGKELIVDTIHYNSVRKHEKLVKINCAAIPKNLIESELFGYEKGAFTNADSTKIGKIEEANNGTLFLDEICEIKEELQTKLLRILENKSFERLGSNKQIYSDFRLICATNKNIEEEIEKGNFRKDLFYRISSFQIETPALRERKEDIPLLAQHFINIFKADYITPVNGMSDEVLKMLQRYRWPGNVRELKNVVQRVISVSSNKEVTVSDLPTYIIERIENQINSDTLNSIYSLEELEKEHIINVLKSVNYNKEKASNILGISKKTLYNKIKKYRL
ncbi:sigma-54-dependent transcriptional regulator [Sporosalibacterium faouarense]|uniref:sigma-54-dependent transcriptional regulator n=1 Tax=Sporosalibacterium faouarense TaxID=516123 RepID=UPI00141D0444|nr:sigma-54 dependent transcriptional regulator [Sporosalibacterium faouarense]MTI47394.1 sigma-54-dependent Fis family transcriptional regulator [Bacillota bacterium]